MVRVTHGGWKGETGVVLDIRADTACLYMPHVAESLGKINWVRLDFVRRIGRVRWGVYSNGDIMQILRARSAK
jgi:hypothetical protein